MVVYSDKVLDLARKFVNAYNDYRFTINEQRALNFFFSNLDFRVFFMHRFPANIGATLLAMFSRIKNPRGIRGLFVDSFLPQFLATGLPEVEKEFGGNEVAFLKARGITSLDQFINYSADSAMLFQEFYDGMGGAHAIYFKEFAESKKAKKFLTMWLDKYGHNSIARVGSLWVCFEGISILAAKSLEWNRPGSGFIELSTRYVDMSGKGCYPVELELEAGWGVPPQGILQQNEFSFSCYGQLAGNNFDGMLPSYLRKKFGHLFDSALKDLESGVIGETCDVLGNLLPTSTLTSVGVSVSGEAFPAMLRHLLLDNTPENIALVELTVKESKKVGADQFARHYEPTEWEVFARPYVPMSEFSSLALESCPVVKQLIPEILRMNNHSVAEQFVKMVTGIKRGEFDKLPRSFELMVSPTFLGIMSFRGWRDLQRQGLCTHMRTLLAPSLGFYSYDKLAGDGPSSSFLSDSFDRVASSNWALYNGMLDSGVPPILAQYPMALGHNIGFVVGANLRQWEFCNWQRTKFSVNHEVRQVFLAVENSLRDVLPWWQHVSRADTTPAYVFARGESGVPLLT
ncbi:MAG: FAD-dependent thymidylate synthase [Candidatus Paceibacterota bacterium]